MLQGLGIISATGNKGGTGLSLENAREGRMQDVLVYGFGDGVGVLVGQNCWTTKISRLAWFAPVGSALHCGGHLSRATTKSGTQNFAVNSAGAG